jgi:hypothetical protein
MPTARAKGTHRAVARYERWRDRYRYVLRCDIAFPGSQKLVSNRPMIANNRFVLPPTCGGWHPPRHSLPSPSYRRSELPVFGKRHAVAVDLGVPRFKTGCIFILPAFGRSAANLELRPIFASKGNIDSTVGATRCKK